MIDSFISYFSAVLGRAERTCDEYSKELRFFARWLEPDLHEDDALLLATRQDVNAYIAYCNEQGNAESTRARKISCLRTFWTWCVEAGYLDANPIATMPRPRIPATVPRFLSLDEAKQLIISTRSQKDLYYRRRNACIIILLLNTGLRRSELANIKLMDISDDLLFVSGKGKRERFVFLNKSCVRAIRMWLSHRRSDTDFLFVSKQGDHLLPTTISSIVDRELDRAGLSGRKLSAHKMRHTCATLMYRSGTDIRLLQSILGHASISTTEIYTHVLDDQIVQAFKSHPLADF